MGAKGRAGDEARILVHVQPGARQTAVAGWHGDAIKIRVAAPPIGGAANEALRRFLADRLGVGKAAVEIVGGAGSRRKHIRVAGLTRAAALASLVEPNQPSP